MSGKLHSFLSSFSFLKNVGKSPKRLFINFVDEIGVQFGSDTEKMFIFEVLDGRYNKMKPTILISNLPISGIKECIGDRCIDRLREDGGKVIVFDFESQRGK